MEEDSQLGMVQLAVRRRRVRNDGLVWWWTTEPRSLALVYEVQTMKDCPMRKWFLLCCISFGLGVFFGASANENAQTGPVKYPPKGLR